ncbi:DEAD/DEAH box helicase [Aureimonas flava]|uniref:DEAD/DEAH box helicase n=1 Tax=Aureimonas flava TaxID=2320271 RepID=A0A3A1WNE2_9HYPH|nr:DEAD/DEAH box helicase [Aureimonas flava]RIY03417.1 DEAD/DEAH box helicase [Aureimonas flava]
MAFPPIHPALARALDAREYRDPTPVQRSVAEAAAADRDLLVSAQTGSGKTVAYGIAMGETLLAGRDTLPEAGDPLALVIAPTRELALQVSDELAWLFAEAGARIVTCVGGMDARTEQRALARGAHLVVGTPGRLRDHLERGNLRSQDLRVVVLDEADEMLNLGFREDLEFILEATPAERRTLLFSATLPKPIVALTRRYQSNAMRIEVANQSSSHSDIEYRAIRVAPTEIEHAVVNLLRQAESPTAIVFCNTREQVRHLHTGLLDRGFGAVSLSGELGQAERNQALQALRDVRSRVCVATDVAARGIDLPNLGLVIHAELPNDAETLQHRSGRTGRAGRKGVSVLLVPLSRRRKADRLLTEAKIRPVWSAPPSADEIRALDRERLLTDALFSEEAGDDDLATAGALLERFSAMDIASAFARLYRQKLPAPEDIYDPGPGRDDKSGRKTAGEAKPRREGQKEDGGGRHAIGPAVWFHLDIGRRNNADPKWLLPLLCRRGKVTRDDIGAIRIFDKETKVEIRADAAERFGTAAQGSDDDITVTRLEGGAPPAGRDRDEGGKAGRPPRAQKAFARRNDGEAPRKGPKKFKGKGPGKPRRPE